MVIRTATHIWVASANVLYHFLLVSNLFFFAVRSSSVHYIIVLWLCSLFVCLHRLNLLNTWVFICCGYSSHSSLAHAHHSLSYTNIRAISKQYERNTTTMQSNWLHTKKEELKCKSTSGAASAYKNTKRLKVCYLLCYGFLCPNHKQKYTQIQNILLRNFTRPLFKQKAHAYFHTLTHESNICKISSIIALNIKVNKKK